MERIRNASSARGLWAIGLLILLGVLLWLSPAERTLGQTVKLIYLHGALVRTALFLLAIGLPFSLVGLLRGRPRSILWGQAFFGSATVIWLVHTLFSMVTTRIAWGVWIAWFEPRTRFTFGMAATLLIAIAAIRLVDDPRFAALAATLTAGAALLLIPRLGAVQHPLDPIGTSPSNLIKGFYAAIVLASTALGGLLALWLHAKLAASSGGEVPGHV